MRRVQQEPCRGQRAEIPAPLRALACQSVPRGRRCAVVRSVKGVRMQLRSCALDPTVVALAPSGIAVAKGSLSPAVPCVLVRCSDAPARDSATNLTEIGIARVASPAPFREARAAHDESSGSLHGMRTSHDGSANGLRVVSTPHSESAASLAARSTALDVSGTSVDVSGPAFDTGFARERPEASDFSCKRRIIRAAASIGSGSV